MDGRDTTDQLALLDPTDVVARARLLRPQNSPCNGCDFGNIPFFDLKDVFDLHPAVEENY